MPKKWKISLFKSYHAPVLMYEAETWTWNKADTSRLMATELQFLRSLEGNTKREENI
jgi:hypothetical protein